MNKNLAGKKIKFLEDVFYGHLNEFNHNIKQAVLASGIEFNDILNDEMDQKQFDELVAYLNEIGFIKGDSIIIPKGAIAEITYDNAGNDVDLQFDTKLNINIMNNFTFNGNKTDDEQMLVEIVA